ncbi:MAG: O-antigen ligase family protein [Kiritimatiellae bacterium]|nr:O-antigen ligase family protein [Kiritimatiellia bacterium]
MRALTFLLAICPAVAAVWAPLWSGDGPSSQMLLWFSGAAVLGTFLLPQLHTGEGRLEAMRRVAIESVFDPFAYAALATLALLVVPLYNVALCPGCDAAAIAAGANPLPPFRWLPFCVNTAEHESVLRWFATAFATAFALRRALVLKWKRVAFETIVWNSAALSVYGFAKLISAGADPDHSFAVFGYANHGGAFFELSLAMAYGLWGSRITAKSQESEEAAPSAHPILSRHYPVFAVALCLFGCIATLCRAAMLFAVAFSVIFFVYIFVASMSGRRQVHRVKGLSGVLILIAVVLSVMIYAPPEVADEFMTLTTRGIADRASGKGQYHERVAAAMMRDFPLFGVGGWGYRHFCQSYMTKKEKIGLQSVGGANVHNDYLQFSAEHGIVGFALIAAVFLLLSRSVWRGWASTYEHFRFARTERTPVSPQAVYAVDPAVFFAVVGVLAILLHALGDCPLRSPPVLTVLFASLASVPGYFDLRLIH